jgi:hypothetical protein
MSAILLKDFPEKLHNEARHRALDEGITLKELFVRALDQYLHGMQPPKGLRKDSNPQGRLKIR